MNNNQNKDQGAAVRGEAVAYTGTIMLKAGVSAEFHHGDFVVFRKGAGDSLYILKDDVATLHARFFSARAADAPSEPSVSILSGALNHARDTLRYYAEQQHFIRHQPDEWDTVSGEHQSLYEDSSNTATVEDGTLAKNTLNDIAGVEAYASVAADVLDSQPTDDRCAECGLHCKAGKCIYSQPQPASQSIGEDAQFGELLENVASRYHGFKRGMNVHGFLSAVTGLHGYIDHLLDSRASSAPVAPIAPAVGADDRLVSIHDGDVMQHSAYGEGIFFTHDCLREVPAPQQEGSEAGNG